MKDKLSLEKIETSQWCRELHVLESIGSTNDYAKLLASQGVPEGTVVVAESQSAGRGRMGRSFFSPQGQGLYLSCILRPTVPPDQLMHLTCCLAVAACDAVEGCAGFRPKIKWTNDLVYGGRKLAGVLTEMTLGGEGGTYVVAGVGINCFQEPEDFAPEIRTVAGSLKMVCGREIDRNQLAGGLIGALERMSSTMTCDRLKWMEQYRKDCMTLGCNVSVQKADTIRHGKAVGIDQWGALLVDFGTEVETVQAGEVSVRGMYGYV